MNDPKKDLQLLIATTLRAGVTAACIVALVGGIIYLAKHGGDPMPDYSDFSYGDAAFHPSEYTTLGGILAGLASWTAASWVQAGVVLLILTPIMRVVLSLVDFVRLRDWLYVAISTIVLTIIICNSLGLF